jgi:hypothetical protein
MKIRKYRIVRNIEAIIMAVGVGIVIYLAVTGLKSYGFGG